MLNVANVKQRISIQQDYRPTSSSAWAAHKHLNLHESVSTRCDCECGWQPTLSLLTSLRTTGHHRGHLCSNHISPHITQILNNHNRSPTSSRITGLHREHTDSLSEWHTEPLALSNKSSNNESHETYHRLWWAVYHLTEPLSSVYRLESAPARLFRAGRLHHSGHVGRRFRTKASPGCISVRGYCFNYGRWAIFSSLILRPQRDPEIGRGPQALFVFPT